MNRILLILIILLCSVEIINAQPNQDARLASQFFRKGEYEKAAALYKKIYESNKKRSHYYRTYLKCLFELRDFATAEQLIKEQMYTRKSDVTLLVDMGTLYKRQEKDAQAKTQFEKAIATMDKAKIRTLANAFSNASEYEYAIKTFEKGKEMSKKGKAFAYDLARIYQKQGEYEKMIESYLDYGATKPNSVQSIKNMMSKPMQEEANMEELQMQLYARIQDEPENLFYVEMLIWALEQQKDYESALVQVKAIDTRKKEEGGRIMDLAQRAFIEKQYDVAIDAYAYILEKGTDNHFYSSAKMATLKSKKNQLTENAEYTKEQITELEKEYLEALKELGRTPETSYTMRDLSHIYAYYLYDVNKAVNLLQEVLKMGGSSRRLKAQSKLDLGDYYLIKGEVWEATLLYSQVDKDHKEDALGEKARFKNAELSYFNGDFGWAQAQLDVLKASTSELIANDALELSVFITDNLGLDTTQVPMQMFARSELLMVQNKTNQSVSVLDSLNRMFPGHALDDDILMNRAEIKIAEREYEAAVPYLEKVVANYATDLKADDALFRLAELYSDHLNDKAKAMDYYQTLLIDHPGSLLIVEARKRYRKLRGDAFN